MRFKTLILTLSLGLGIEATAPSATVLNGSYTGIYSQEYNQDFFLGIPFSQPPTGDLRFRQAQSLNSTWSGSRNATAYSPQCIGYGSDTWILGNIISEDCLTLNVVRPSGHNESTKLPVAVWVHGGGQTTGGSSDPRYNLSFIVQESVQSGSPFIAVSINYRLHAWGYIFGQEVLSSGSANLGLKDIRLSLHWIQENIAAFGGDPTKVTIWGESAGARGVGMQLLAYGGRDDGLFRGAIMQSGGTIGGAAYGTPAQWQPYYDRIVNATNCTGSIDTLACLRTVPTEILSVVFNSSVTTGATWAPQLDGDFLQDTGSAQLKQGKFVKVPILLGHNTDEGSQFAARPINTTEQFLAVVRANGASNSTTLTVAALYPDIPAIGIPSTLTGRPPPSRISSLGFQYKRAASYAGDLQVHVGRRLAAQMWAQKNVSAYSYHFNVLVNGMDSTMGVAHFTEVAFVFANVRGDGYINAISSDPFAGKPDTYKQVASMMARMWVSFIVDQDPNNSGETAAYWPKYTLDDPRNIVFDANVTNLTYVEPDLYRAEGIAYLTENMRTSFNR